MSPVIAWNGSTGTVGRTALRYFLRRWDDESPAGTAQAVSLELRLTGRSTERLEAVAAEVSAAYPQHKVRVCAGCDAEQDPADWPGAPLTGADLLVNTAGPGYVVTPRLARYCLTHNIAYADPSGDHSMVAEIMATSDLPATYPHSGQASVPVGETPTAPAGQPADVPAVTVPLILGAGIQPGLSGILVRLLARAAGPGATVELYSGGAQPTTEAALHEFVDSVNSGMLWAGKEWVDGQLRASCLPESYLAQVAATFSPTAVAHAHCDREVAAAAAAAQAHSVRWHNVSDAPKTTLEIQKMIAGDATVEQVMEAARMDDFGRRHYFRMEGTAVSAGLSDAPLREFHTPLGESMADTMNSSNPVNSSDPVNRADPSEMWHATLECVDSFLVTASVTAIAALYALRRACPSVGAAQPSLNSGVGGCPATDRNTAGAPDPVSPHGAVTPTTAVTPVVPAGVCLPVDLPDTDYWWEDIMKDPATVTTSLRQ
ncbi:hypothetical protein, partial [Lawsonella clevelandensis]